MFYLGGSALERPPDGICAEGIDHPETVIELVHRTAVVIGSTVQSSLVLYVVAADEHDLLGLSLHRRSLRWYR